MLSPMQKRLSDESGGRCYYCGVLLKDHVCIEHVIPRSRGGSDRMANLVAACTSCNNKKASFLIEELRSRIMAKAPIFKVVFYFEHAGLTLKGLLKSDHHG
jgi:5-methylcytosine-specific restriction endonuclease McrA